MPSGAKKRKAAKKKKEIHPNPPSSSTPAHRDGDGDGKESEVSSPASLDRHSPRNAFSGEETEGTVEVAVEDSDRKDEKSEHDGSSSTASDEETSFEEMKYRQSENENAAVSLKTQVVDISSQDGNNNEEKSITPHVDVVSGDLSAVNNVPIAAASGYGVSEQRRDQTTSWKSCCGLLEVFTGSGR